MPSLGSSFPLYELNTKLYYGFKYSTRDSYCNCIEAGAVTLGDCGAAHVRQTGGRSDLLVGQRAGRYPLCILNMDVNTVCIGLAIRHRGSALVPTTLVDLDLGDGNAMRITT